MGDTQKLLRSNIRGVSIKMNFEEHDMSKPYCVLGVLNNENGREIEKEMLSWLIPLYDVYSVYQDPPGKLFEYPAIKFLRDLVLLTEETCLYLHTKGAFNTGETQTHVRYMWKTEFGDKRDQYIKELSENKPMVACPFTGKAKTTWYNGFMINYPAAKTMKEIPLSGNRYVYETLFKRENNITVKGMIYDDVDDGIGGNKNSESKIRTKRYVENIFKKRPPMTGKEYLNQPNTICVLYPSHLKQQNGRYNKVKETIMKEGKPFIDFSKSPFKRYVGFKLNDHHFTLNSHYDIFLPELCKKMNIPYKKEDFHKVEYKSKTGFDLSYLAPNEDFQFIFEMDGKKYEGGFDILLGFGNMNFPNEYHMLFRGAHHSCIIHNKNIHNGRKLILSGDSHNVPQIPVLACYFETIVYLDNRDSRQMNVGPAMPCGFDYNQYKYTDIVFSFFEFNAIEKYTMANFKK